MDKAEYKTKLESISKLAESGNYKAAAAHADEIDWKRVRSVRTLCMIAEIYAAVKRYEDALNILLQAYKRTPSARAVLYALAEVEIRLGDFQAAEKYINEFEQNAPGDSSNYILKYKLLRAKGVTLDEQIEVLRQLKDREYTERWSYELAKLYRKNGQKQKCIDECDELILWFAEGRYVKKALDLKKSIAPLTADQQKLYDKMLEDPELAGAGTENPHRENKDIKALAGETIRRLDNAAESTVGVRTPENREIRTIAEDAVRGLSPAATRKKADESSDNESVSGTPVYEVSSADISYEDTPQSSTAWETSDQALDRRGEAAEKTVDGAGETVREAGTESAQMSEPAADSRATVGEAGTESTETKDASQAEGQAGEAEYEANVTSDNTAAENTETEGSGDIDEPAPEADISSETIAAAADERTDRTEKVPADIETASDEAESSAESVNGLRGEENVPAENAAVLPESADALSDEDSGDSEADALKAAIADEEHDNIEDEIIRNGLEDVGLASLKSDNAGNEAARLKEMIPESGQNDDVPALEKESDDGGKTVTKKEKRPGLFARIAESLRLEDTDDSEDDIPDSETVKEEKTNSDQTSPETEAAVSDVDELLSGSDTADAEDGGTLSEADTTENEASDGGFDLTAGISQQNDTAFEEDAAKTDSSLTSSDNNETDGKISDPETADGDNSDEEIDSFLRKTSEREIKDGAVSYDGSEAYEEPEITLKDVNENEDSSDNFFPDASAGYPETFDAFGRDAARETAREAEKEDGPLNTTGRFSDTLGRLARAGEETSYKEDAAERRTRYSAFTGEVREAGGRTVQTPDELMSPEAQAEENGESSSAAGGTDRKSENNASGTDGQKQADDDSMFEKPAQADEAGKDNSAPFGETTSRLMTDEELQELFNETTSQLKSDIAGGGYELTDTIKNDDDTPRAQNTAKSIEDANKVHELLGRETDESLGLTREINYSEIEKQLSSGQNEKTETEETKSDKIPDPESAARETAFEANGRPLPADDVDSTVGTVEEYGEGEMTDEELLAALNIDDEAKKELLADEAENAGSAKGEESLLDMSSVAPAVHEESRAIIDNIMEKPDVYTRLPLEGRKLTDAEKKAFSYFAQVPGVDYQVTTAIADIHNNSGDKTSRSGNVVIVGRQGSGKTRLAEGLVMAACMNLGMKACKLARIVSDEMNEKDPAKVVAKLSGGFLLIEAAGGLNDATIDGLNKAMEFRTDDLIVILEDEKADMRKMLNAHPDFAKKFTSMITVPVFMNDELVTFAKTYAKEQGYKLDELATLALYTIIGENQRDDEPVTVGRVKRVVDKAIEKSSRKFFGKTQDSTDGRILLREKDFNF